MYTKFQHRKISQAHPSLDTIPNEFLPPSILFSLNFILQSISLPGGRFKRGFPYKNSLRVSYVCHPSDMSSSS